MTLQKSTYSTTIGEENPFRYRGYYFDIETGLYYLNSRYYDSVTGRFINADGLISSSSTLLGTNMYAYCENNPVINFDSEGMKGRNSIRNYYSESSGYLIVSTRIRYEGGIYEFKYEVGGDGSIAFDFSMNSSYHALMNRGGDKMLIHSMYEAVIKKTRTLLSNRTFQGLRYELKAHYDLLMMSNNSKNTTPLHEFIYERARVANMGSTSFPYIIRGMVPDPDCIFFEIAAPIIGYGVGKLPRGTRW